MTIVLDSWAVIAVFHGEPSAERIREAVMSRGPVVMSWVNLGEVVYIEARRDGWDTAVDRVTSFAASVLHAETADAAITLSAARWKAEGGLSYADAFAAATAERHDAPLYTGDPELLALGDRLAIVDLR